ncbi:MAG: ParA family protein [Candidatus Krumholzibacteriota bacterium]
MRIIAVAMTKGGVGKTTTAVNLSHGLAQRGHRVLLVDADTQGQCAKALGVEADLTLTDVLTEDVHILDVVTRARENLDLVASDYHLAKGALAISRREWGGHLALAEVLEPAADRYDVAVIDAAPGFDAIAVNVLGCAHDVVAPVALTPAALAGVLDFVRHVGSVQKHNTRLNLRYVLPTFLDLRVRQSTEMMGQLRGHFGSQLCTPIRVNVDLAEAFGFQSTIFEHAPSSRGAGDYTRFIERVESDGRVLLGDKLKQGSREEISTDRTPVGCPA